MTKMHEKGYGFDRVPCGFRLFVLAIETPACASGLSQNLIEVPSAILDVDVDVEAEGAWLYCPREREEGQYNQAPITQEAGGEKRVVR
jgi:hypothetical protein